MPENQLKGSSIYENNTYYEEEEKMIILGAQSQKILLIHFISNTTSSQFIGCVEKIYCFHDPRIVDVTKDLVSLFQYSDFDLSNNVTDKSNDYIVGMLSN